MGSMKMLSASEPEIMENRSETVEKRSDIMEKLQEIKHTHDVRLYKVCAADI